MQKIKESFWLGPVISGLLTFIAVCHFNFFAAWICYVPLFISINDNNSKLAFKKGLVFGLVFSIPAFFWMIPGAERFTGYNMFYGLAVFLASAIFYTCYCAALLFSIAALKRPDNNLRSIIGNSILTAALFCIAESLLRFVSTGLPWFDFHSGNGLAANIYTIQSASVLGVHILTFITVGVNYLVALIAIKKWWTKLYIPAAVIITSILTGLLLLNNFEDNLPVKKPFNVAILAENISPDIKWDDNTGNMLVQRLLDLNHLAVTHKPDIALWSESAVPWTYSKDDDLVKEVFKITDPASITHVMGINTAYKENEIYNSAYYILPGGNVSGRYDKQFLLSFIEKPMYGWLIPFFSSKGFYARNDLSHSKPLTTSYGKAGFLICNEAAIPAAAATQVKQGAEFLLNMSNDGWFSDTYIVKAHFYYARLRAVESRKDLAINCNNGYSGLIKASGEIAEQEKSEDPFVTMVSMQPNNMITTVTKFPNLFVYCCAAYIAIMAVFNFISIKKEHR